MKKAMMTIVLLLAITILLTACAKTPNTPAESLATNGAMSQSTSSSTTGNNNENENPAPPLTAEQKLLLSRKEELTSAMAENTKDYKVLYCGKAGNPTLADGEKAIWVKELFKAYPNSTDKAEASIKAVYVYYPMHDDPSQFTDAQLKSKGAMRVFAYIGIPDGATAQNKVND